jgi:hypothetical protein
VKPGNLVHFVDCKETLYDTLGMIIGFMPSQHYNSIRHLGLFKVKWYDDPSCGVEDYDKEDLELVSEGWKFSQ